MMPVILLPVKNPGRAKSRLSPLFTTEERSAFTRAMFADVARALEEVNLTVVLVTDSESASAHARFLGWRVFWESEQISESASIDAASRQIAHERAGAALRIPADVPLVKAVDIKELTDRQLSERSAILVPSRDGTGTNAILRSPPDLFPSRFGPGSLELHKQEAMRAGASWTVIENPRLGLDLDDVHDVMSFLRKNSDTETQRFLMRMPLHERIEQRAVQVDFH
jgi:2-phospho-L-lactate guanylyltransferase